MIRWKGAGIKERGGGGERAERMDGEKKKTESIKSIIEKKTK